MGEKLLNIKIDILQHGYVVSITESDRGITKVYVDDFEGVENLIAEIKDSHSITT